MYTIKAVNIDVNEMIFYGGIIQLQTIFNYLLDQYIYIWHNSGHLRGFHIAIVMVVRVQY